MNPTDFGEYQMNSFFIGFFFTKKNFYALRPMVTVFEVRKAFKVITSVELIDLYSKKIENCGPLSCTNIPQLGLLGGT